MSGAQACRWEEGTQCGGHDYPFDRMKGPGCSLLHASVHRREVAARGSVVHRLDIAGGSRRKDGSPALVVPEQNWFPLKGSLRRLSRPRSDTAPLAVYSSTNEMLARCHGIHQPKECMHGPYGQMPAAAGHRQEMYLLHFYFVYTDSYASTRIAFEMSSPNRIILFSDHSSAILQ